MQLKNCCVTFAEHSQQTQDWRTERLWSCENLVCFIYSEDCM